MSPRVSILIPCYNAAHWLAQTLESVFAQTWANCEVILVDDGSTDDSLAIAKRHAARGLRVQTQANRGPSSANNHALSVASGDYIKFLDADDLLSPNMVEIQVAALRDRPGAIAYGEWARFHADPAEAQFVHRPGWHDAAPADWLVETWDDALPMMQCGQFLLPRELLQRTGGWDERLTLINDFEFFTRLITASSGVVFTPGARLYYRSGMTGSVSRRRSRKAWESALLSAKLGTDHLLHLEDSPRTRRAAANILQQLVYDMYPAMPGLVRELEERVARLGGCDHQPLGGRGFHLARRIVGWKLARRLQILAGKYPAPADDA